MKRYRRIRRTKRVSQSGSKPDKRRAVPLLLQQCIDAKTSDGKPPVEGMPFTPSREWLCKFILKHGRFPRVHLKSNYEPQWRENQELHCVYGGDKNRYFSGACWFDECILAPGETMEV